jgi:HJR/Mrr/RecB family endonuclease
MFKELRDFEGFSSFYKYIKIREKLINLIKIKKEQSEKDNFISNLKNGKKSSTISYDEIINMNGYEFEQLIAELFNGIGYRAEVTKSSGDQGVDVILYKNSERIGIQAKRYTGKVTNKAVQEIVAGVKHYNLDRGIVISTAEYTKSAIELAHSNNIELWGKQKLMDLVKKSS